jgi:hypothetical protein
MDIETALAKIEKQFGRESISKEEWTAMMVERGHLCVMCHKARGYCKCDCKCKACWGMAR